MDQSLLLQPILTGTGKVELSLPAPPPPARTPHASGPQPLTTKSPASSVTPTSAAQMTTKTRSSFTNGPLNQPSGLQMLPEEKAHYHHATTKRSRSPLANPRKLLNTFGTRWPGIRSETQELISDCSMHQEDLHLPGLLADIHQKICPRVTPEYHNSSCTLTSPNTLQSATPQSPLRWPNPVTSSLSCASNGLIS